MNDSQDKDQLLQDLLKRVEALERQAPKDQLTLGVMSGDLERTMTAFIIALAATTFDMEVDMVFTLRATAALRDPKKIKKDLQDWNRQRSSSIWRSTAQCPSNNSSIWPVKPECGSRSATCRWTSWISTVKN